MAKDRLVTPSYCCILAANFLLYFGFYLLMPVLPFYLTEVFHTGNTMVGIALSCYTVAALTIRPFSGYLLDTLARKPLYLISFLHFYDDFRRLPVRRVADAFHHPADRPWLCVRYGHRIGQYRGNRHHALIAARRRNRILRPDEQHGDGDRPDGRDCSCTMFYSFPVIFLSALTSCSLGWIMASLVRTPPKEPVKRAACLARPLHPRSKASRPGSTCCCCLFPTA